MSSNVLTIDIQQDQISFVLLSHGLKGIRVVETACCRIIQETKGDEPFTAIKDSLTRIRVKMGERHDRCIISLPATYFFFRTLDMPFKNRKKISRILPFELEPYLPWPVEDLSSDFCLLPKNSKGLFEKNMAGVAGIRNRYLEQFKALFDDCRIHPDGITVGSGYAAALLYAGTESPSDFCLFIHAEPLLASVHAVRFGEIAFSRIFLLDSRHPARSVKTNLTHTLLAFNELFDNSLDLKEIIVSGTASFLKTLGGDIEKEMAVPVRAFDLFKIEKLLSASEESFSDNHYDDVQNAIAIGINEIKGFETYNFSRQVSDFTVFYQENKLNIMVSAALCFFLFLAWTINPVIRINRMEKRIEQLDKSIVRVFKSCFPDVTTIVDPAHQMQVKVAALQEQKNIDFFDEYPLCIDVLNEISKSLPSSLDIVFSRFVRTENNVLVTGSADQFNTIDNMKNRFENIAFFKDVDIQSASMDKTDKRVTFNLKIVL